MNWLNIIDVKRLERIKLLSWDKCLLSLVSEASQIVPLEFSSILQTSNQFYFHTISWSDYIFKNIASTWKARFSNAFPSSLPISFSKWIKRRLNHQQLKQKTLCGRMQIVCQTNGLKRQMDERRRWGKLRSHSSQALRHNSQPPHIIVSWIMTRTLSQQCLLMEGVLWFWIVITFSTEEKPQINFIMRTKLVLTKTFRSKSKQ